MNDPPLKRSGVRRSPSGGPVPSISILGERLTCTARAATATARLWAPTKAADRTGQMSCRMDLHRGGGDGHLHTELGRAGSTCALDCGSMRCDGEHRQ